MIGTWNLRAFGDLTEKWKAGPKDSPKRDLHALRLIAEVVRCFDVVALQEVKGNIKALRHMLRLLGPEWGLVLTDVVAGKAGNDERLAFVFDTRRLKMSGLACELVIPEEWMKKPQIKQGALDRQFARTPYAVSFRWGAQTFILVTLHVIYGKKAAERSPELRAIAGWLADWAARTSDEFNQNLIALGDFNIDRQDDPNWQAFTSRGLRPAPELQGLSRTIFDKPQSVHFYDQIAWFVDEGQAKLTLDYSGRAGRVDFLAAGILPGLSKTEISWRVSDHYPLWAEFRAP